MLTIRLTRKGKKNQPFFRVVVVDKRKSASGGRNVEELGYKNPLTKKVSINKERALYWLGVGAQPSDTVHNLFVSEKIIETKKIANAKPSKKARAAAAKAAEEAAKAAEAEKKAAAAAKEESASPAGESADSKPAEPAPAEAPKEPASPADEQPKA